MFYLIRFLFLLSLGFIAWSGSASAQRCPTPNPNITAGVAGHPFFSGCPLPAEPLNRLPVLSGPHPVGGNIATYVEVPGVSLAIGDSGVGVAGVVAARAPTNTALKALPTVSLISGESNLYRQGNVAPGDGGAANYTYTSSPCTLNGGNGDNGSQVKASDNGCYNIVRTPVADPKVFGAKCDGSTDDTPALNAQDAYFQTIGGGTFLYSCTLKVDGTWHLSGSETVRSSTQHYGGMSFDPGPSQWPPANNVPAVNCTNTGVSMCIDVAGVGIIIDGHNFGNPQPIPISQNGTLNGTTTITGLTTSALSVGATVAGTGMPLTATITSIDSSSQIHISSAATTSGTHTLWFWKPNIYPPVIGTDNNSGWQGLTITNSICTTCTTFVDLEGTPDYTTAYTGADIYLNALYCNVCLGTAFILHRIDNVLYSGFLSNADPQWYGNNLAVGTYLRNHATMLRLEYVAAPQFGTINCYAIKLCMEVKNGTVTNSFGTLVIAGSAIQIGQFMSNNACQTIVATDTDHNTNIEIKGIDQLYVWGDETGFQCSKGKAMIDLPSNLAKVTLGQVAITDVDTFANIGCGTPNTGGCPSGAIVAAAVFHMLDAYALQGFSGYGYGAFTPSAPFIKAPAVSFIDFSRSDTRLIVGHGGGLLTAGLDGTQASLQFSVNGFVLPSGQTAVNLGALPTVCTGLPTGTLWATTISGTAAVSFCP